MNAPNRNAPKARLLVVDDEVALVTALRNTLRHEGYELVGVTSPTEALDVLRRQTFDLLLTDLHLPEMDGISLLRMAREIDPRLIPIMMTGHGSVDSAVEAMKAGALDYILKPFKLSLVLAVLSRALDVRRLRLENEELDRRLRARTAELEVANNDLRAFSYSVSHDLRAPLRVIEGLAAVLQDELGSAPLEELRRHVGRIIANAERMNGLIDDLFRLAQAADAQLRHEPVDLADVARELAARFAADTPARRVEWRVAESLPVNGDRALLRVAMENLLSNAWKYTAGRDAARIEVGAEPQPDGTQVFFVRDDGVGFDASTATRLFTPFQRYHADTEFSGTGVGLAIVHRIIQKHGGRIWAESTRGRGATFRFTLSS